jgi:hypothetical protein
LQAEEAARDEVACSSRFFYWLPSTPSRSLFALQPDALQVALKAPYHDNVNWPDLASGDLAFAMSDYVVF